MDAYIFAALFHPGDLSRWELAGLIGVFSAACVLPIAIIGFIIYRVVVGHSEDSDTVTLSINESQPPKQ